MSPWEGLPQSEKRPRKKESCSCRCGTPVRIYDPVSPVGSEASMELEAEPHWERNR
jgi:hypothetical protein